MSARRDRDATPSPACGRRWPREAGSDEGSCLTGNSSRDARPFRLRRPWRQHPSSDPTSSGHLPPQAGEGVARRRTALSCIAALAATLVLAACDTGSGPDITIVAGSENKPFEPLVQSFCAARGAHCSFVYQGSLDIGFGLRAGTLQADVVWPASSVWIDVFDDKRRVSHLQSISQSPVLLGVRKSKADALGWTKHDVAYADILAAVKAGKLKFLMSSATQSNSGAAAYLAMLNAAAGKGDVLTQAELDDPAVRERARTLLSGVERTAGSSGWLADLFLAQDETGAQYDAMWNYEFVLKETNDTLAARAHDPLWMIYPKDGVAVSDGPIGYLDRGRGPEVEKFVTDLEADLRAPEAQEKIAKAGRRVEGAAAAEARPVPEWNFDPSRPVTALRPPEPKVLFAALNLYQEALRRPSLTALCLDVSGSMSGPGIDQLRRAMSFLFTPDTTRAALVQWTPSDHIVAIPFSGQAYPAERGTGAPGDQARLKAWGQTLDAIDGTDMYPCARAALAEMRGDLATRRYLPALLIMTDGRSEGDMEGFIREWTRQAPDIPIFGVTFGDADTTQLDRVAEATGGRVFDGHKDLAEAFRAARGYN